MEEEEKVPVPKTIHRQELIDDYIRNFFMVNGLKKSLEAFQKEWYSIAQKGKSKASEYANIPDVKVKNQKLRERIHILKSQVYEANLKADKAKSTWGKLKKKKEYHKENHQRIEEEKIKLKEDKSNLDKLQALYDEKYQELTIKYEAAMKEKMLIKMEKRKLDQDTQKLRKEIDKIHNMIKNKGEGKADDASYNRENEISDDPSQKRKKRKRKRGLDKIPQEDETNPYLTTSFEPFPSKNINETKEIKAHDGEITALVVHPRKAFVATGSDDRSWKIWSLGSNEPMLSVDDGHEDWVSCLDFSPLATMVATGSGDSTINVYNLMDSSNITFTQHKQPVWSLSFHHTGDFLVSGSMDHSCRLFDIPSQSQLSILRGHVDSVNKVKFLPFSNTFATASADKSISLWDIRTGLCVQTFYGHLNSVSSLDINVRVSHLAYQG